MQEPQAIVSLNIPVLGAVERRSHFTGVIDGMSEEREGKGEPSKRTEIGPYPYLSSCQTLLDKSISDIQFVRSSQEESGEVSGHSLESQFMTIRLDFLPFGIGRHAWYAPRSHRRLSLR